MYNKQCLLKTFVLNTIIMVSQFFFLSRDFKQFTFELNTINGQKYITVRIKLLFITRRH